jgi:dihydrodipicolinate synthase/N-acetylneuraminate lyase
MSVALSLSIVADAIDGRRPFYVHITTPEIELQVEQGRHAMGCGAAAVIAMPPYCRGLDT